MAAAGGRISIPGSLAADDTATYERRRTLSFAEPQAKEEEEEAAADLDEEEEEEAAAAVDSDAATESSEFDSDLDAETPHYAEGERPPPISGSGSRRRRSPRPQPPERLLSRAQQLAARFAARGHAGNALRQLVRQTALCVLVFGPQHHRYADSYVQLARGYLQLRGSNFAQQAEDHASHAKNILLGTQPEEQSLLSEADRLDFLQISINAFHTLGRAQSLLKKFSEAEQSFLKAEKLLRELRKIPSATHDFLEETRIRVWTALAKISSKLSKPAVAISYYEQAIAACEKRHGDTAPELVPLYQGVGNVEQSRDEFPNHEKAIDMYLRAHEIATKQSGGDFSAATAGTARALSAAYARCGSGVADSSAESYLQESLTAYLQLHGPEHPTVCEVQDEMAKLMIRGERPDDGARLLQETLKVKARVFGDYSPEVLESYRLLGSLWLSRGRFEKAAAHLQRAKDIAEFLQGPACRAAKELAATIHTIMQHPSMEGKQVGAEMKNRPRFQGIVARSRQPAAAGGGVFN